MTVNVSIISCMLVYIDCPHALIQVNALLSGRVNSMEQAKGLIQSDECTSREKWVAHGAPLLLFPMHAPSQFRLRSR